MRDSVADPRRAREFALLLGEGAKYPRLMARYVETMLEPRREVIRSVLRRGVAAGELRPDTDIEVALFMLTGAVLARGKYDPGSFPPGYAERVVAELLLGLSPRYQRGHDNPSPRALTGPRPRSALAGAAAGGPAAVRDARRGHRGGRGPSARRASARPARGQACGACPQPRPV